VDWKEFRERYNYDAQRDLLGEGGFGRVYRARDSVLDRDVALKIFSRSVPQQYDLISEIKKAIQLNHQNICRYYYAEVIRGTDALGESQVIQAGIMEFIEGGTIDRFLSKHPQFRRKLLMDVLHGLSYLHQHQPPIIHRDLKPANVLVGFVDGCPVAKITDFGLSKLASASGTGLSVTGQGTYAYMAPEQFNPARFGVNGKIQCNLDIWSFGAMLIELLTGALPFGAGDPDTGSGQIMEAIVRGVPTEFLNGFEEPYRRVLERCMVQDAGKRAQSAAELIELLNGASSTVIEVPSPTVIESRPQWTQDGTENDVHSPHVAAYAPTRLESVSSPTPTVLHSDPVIEAPTSTADVPNRRMGNFPVWAWAVGVVLLSAASFAAWRGFQSHRQTQPVQAPAVQAVQPSMAQPSQPPMQVSQQPVHGTTHLKQPSQSPDSSNKPKPAEAAQPEPSAPQPEAVEQPRPVPDAAQETPAQTPDYDAMKIQADTLYKQGRYAEAVPLYEQECGPGHHNGACNRLGTMYQVGQGVAQDYSRAIAFYTQACDTGNREACFNSGRMYHLAIGVPRDDPRAAALFYKSCNGNGGYADGCALLGSLYRYGNGVEADPDKARQFLARGCNLGSGWGCVWLKEMR
jgi:serine/threonine protein kinase